MAILQAATTATGAIVTDAQAVRQLCEIHCFGTLIWEVDEEGELTIWGYDSFEVYEAREDNLPDYDGGIVTPDLRRLFGCLFSWCELRYDENLCSCRDDRTAEAVVVVFSG